ncbi:MAG: aspartate aminotransferase family protein [Phototrophicaceae bacterium]
MFAEQTMTYTDEIIESTAENILGTYARAPFLLVHGEGMTLYDSTGKAYLDFMAGIAVNALGYADPELVETLQQSAKSLIHVSNLFYSAPQAELAQMLVALSFADKVFFCNSGAEANEGALKFARKVAYMRGEHRRYERVSFTGGFHGRTMGALSVTPREKYQKPFGPMLPGCFVAEYNNLDSAAATINDKTAAVIVEPVQGEGGIHPATREFLQGLRELCDKHGAMLIFDEVQCGMGRTGDLFSHQFSGVEPDMLTLAKALAGGLPMGAVLVNDKVAAAMEPGDHGTTFGGGVMVANAAKTMLRRVSDPAMLAHITEMGEYLRAALRTIQSAHVVDVRGRGLMCAMELDTPVQPILEAAHEQGLIVISAGANTLRFLPPFIVQKEHIDLMITRLTAAFAACGLME